MLEVQANSFGSAVLAYGGDTFNTAVYLRRCSAPETLQVGYATGVGNDPLSEKLLNEWSGLGLDLSCTQKIEGKLPGMYLIETDDSGERRFHFWRENSAARFYFDVQATPLEKMAAGIDCFYFSGISLAILNSNARERLFNLLQQQKDAGKHVVFDNNYRPRLWPDRTTTQKVFNQAFASGSLFDISGTSYEGALTLQRINRVDGTTGALAGNVVVNGISAGTGSNEGFFAITSNGQVDYFTAVPEPSTYALVALIGALYFFVNKRRKTQSQS
jgi:2-dehydro-3-deoxygluconokinase